jgi:antitoxin (DNA-binding transcriptional repressor) of toxin-antitoxin stability system
MTKVNIQEAKTHLSRYVDRAVQGEVIILCRHNHPVAELRALGGEPERRARVAGLLKGRVDWEPGAFAPMTEEEIAEFDQSAAFPRRRRT